MKESINYVVSQTREIQVTASSIEEAFLTARVRFNGTSESFGNNTIAEGTLRETDISIRETF